MAPTDTPFTNTCAPVGEEFTASEPRNDSWAGGGAVREGADCTPLVACGASRFTCALTLSLPAAGVEDVLTRSEATLSLSECAFSDETVAVPGAAGTAGGVLAGGIGVTVVTLGKESVVRPGALIGRSMAGPRATRQAMSPSEAWMICPRAGFCGARTRTVIHGSHHFIRVTAAMILPGTLSALTNADHTGRADAAPGVSRSAGPSPRSDENARREWSRVATAVS